MKILFVYPVAYFSYPIQVGALSAYLKRYGHTTQLLELVVKNSVTTEDLSAVAVDEKIKSYEPDLIAFSCFETNFEWIKYICDHIKKTCSTPIILGGCFPTLSPEEVISHPSVDIICRGEGEYPLLELAGAINENKDITAIRNLWVKRNGIIYRNDIRALIEDLDQLPFPDREMFDYQRHLDLGEEDRHEVKLIASRGCPYRCTYCCNYYFRRLYPNKDKYLRMRSVDNVLKEIEEISKRYNFDTVGFHDDNFTLNIAWLKEFCQKYSERFKYPFYCSMRPEVCNQDILEMLKKAGCHLLHIGVESGDEILRRKVLHRDMSNYQILRAFRNARRAGISAWSKTMVGLPLERRGSLLKTILLNLRLRPDLVIAAVYYPFKGTGLGDLCHRNQWINLERKKRIGLYMWDTILRHPYLSRTEIKIAKYLNIFTAAGSVFFWKKVLYALKKRAKKMLTSSKAKTKFISFFVMLAGMWMLAPPLYAQPKAELSNLKIIPSEVFTAETMKISFSLKFTQRLENDYFLFLHLEGFGPGRYLNADLALPKNARDWSSNERIDLGPFYVYIPLNLPEGDYRITMGLAYPEETPLGIRYVKIPYTNPEIRGWTVGKVRVKKRPRPLDNYEEGDYTLTVESALKKIFPEKEYFKIDVKDNITLSSARNEFEGFQIVVIPGSEELKDVEIEVSDLINEGRKTLIKKENISLYRVGFVRTSKPYYNTPRVGLWPDPLIPLEERFTVNKETVQPIWMNVYVPDDTPEGNYQGKIIIKPKGFKPKKVEVSLKVWNFNLSKESHLKSAFDFYEYLVDWRHPKKQNESDFQYKKRLEDLKKLYYLDMLRHRVNPIHNVGNPKFIGKIGDRYILEFKEFDERVEFYRKFGQICFGIAQEWPWGYRGDWTDKWYGFTDAQAAEGVFREYGRHLEEKVWLDNVYAYIFDETLNRVKEFTRLIHKGHSGIKNLVTTTPQEGYPDVDIWCVRINNLERPIVEEFRKRGKEIWVYVAGHSRPFPGLNLDLPAAEHRIIPWICWKYNVEGLLYWCINWWHNTNPWDNPMTFPEQNGNGSLYYPDPQGKKPISSIRLEVLRDGLEDYEYFYILQKRLKELKKNPKDKEGLIKKIEEVLNIPEDVVRTSAYFTYDPAKIYKLREEIASLIEMAL